VDITDTALNDATSRLLSLKMAGFDKMYVDRFGTIINSASIYSGGELYSGTGQSITDRMAPRGEPRKGFHQRRFGYSEHGGCR
jgi:hypothetical protein